MYTSCEPFTCEKINRNDLRDERTIMTAILRNTSSAACVVNISFNVHFHQSASPTYVPLRLAPQSWFLATGSQSVSVCHFSTRRLSASIVNQTRSPIIPDIEPPPAPSPARPTENPGPRRRRSKRAGDHGYSARSTLTHRFSYYCFCCCCLFGHVTRRTPATRSEVSERLQNSPDPNKNQHCKSRNPDTPHNNSYEKQL